jgi:hypothetical protein
MNAAHLHLIFTHLPIVGLGFAIFINLYLMVIKLMIEKFYNVISVVSFITTTRIVLINLFLKLLQCNIN